MEARMQHPVFAIADAMPALMSLNKSVEKVDLPPTLRELMNLRASQINGCSVCVAMHAEALKAAGETDDRIHTVAAWRDAPWFTDGERAALALTECVTRLADTADPVPDAVWDDAAQHFDTEQLAAILLSIAQINVWNRLNVATRQLAGGTW